MSAAVRAACRALRAAPGALLLGVVTACGSGVGAPDSRTPVAAAQGAGAQAVTPATDDVSIVIDAGASGPAVNRLLLGSNVQWVDGGDNLLRAGTLTIDPAMQRLVRTMGPTILRYPGGDQSDLYDWRRGVGPLSARGINLQAVTKKPQLTTMGSGEMQALAANLPAALLFTVNMVSSTPADAAAWVRQTNLTGSPPEAGQAPVKVAYWELGNEPYLPNPDGTHPNTCLIDPAAYVARLNAIIPAMRAVDPSIRIGIALSNDAQNGIRVVSPGCSRYASTVLAGLTQDVDFISLHDAYMPYDPSGRDHAASSEYWAAMAAPESVRADFAAMRALLQRYPRFARLPFAVTEYNALFSLDSHSAYLHSMASPMAALYVADLLRSFADRDDVLMANTWSLSGNDHWGAIRSATDTSPAYGRPAYEVFRVLGEALHGVRLPITARAGRFNAAALGFSAAATELPVVTTLVTRTAAPGTAGVLHILMINKDLAAAHPTVIEIDHGTAAAARLISLTAAHVFENDDLPGAMQRTESTVAPGTPMSLTLPPHSIELLTVDLAAAPT